MTRPKAAKQKVLIVGGGFAGIKAALELGDAHAFNVTLLSDIPNFEYNPSLYHTATGGLAVQSSIPLQRIFEGKDVSLEQGKAVKINRKAKTVTTSDGRSFGYETLILALGMETNYFGIKGLAENSFGIKSVDEAEEFKRHLHKQLIDQGKPDLNYLIVGGGPTGIELAGALPGYLRQVMRTHGIRRKNIRITLVEAGPHLLPRLPKRVGKKVERQLRSLGIRLLLGKTVQGASSQGLTVDGKSVASRTIVWTAGQSIVPFFKENDFTLTERGKVAVNEYLQAEPSIYVLGDNNNTQYSGMAQTALRDAEFVAGNLRRALAGQPAKAYKPKKPVYVIPAGPRWAAVLWGRLQLYGIIGWALRSLADLVGFHDIEPWWRATGQWMTEFGGQEDCPICAAHPE